MPTKLTKRRIRAKQSRFAREISTPFGGRVRVRCGTKAQGKETKIILMAYTGKPVEVEGFEYPVIIDIRGARFDKPTTPVIADHRTNNRIGHTVEQLILGVNERGKLGGKTVHGPLIAAIAVRSSNMEVAKGFERDARKGFPFQTSVGATIKNGYLLEEGDTAEINGRVWEGPLIVAKRSITRELSITVLGADNDTSAMVAAKAKLREKAMSFQAWVKSLGLTLAKLAVSQKKRLKAQFDELQKLKLMGKNKDKKLVKAGAGPNDDDDDDGDTEPPGTDDDDTGDKGHRQRPPKVRATRRRVNRSDDGDDDVSIEDMVEGRVMQAQARIEAISELTAEFEDQIDIIEVPGRNGEMQELNLKQFKAHALRKRMSPAQYELQLRRSAITPLDATPSIKMVNKNISAEALECAILRSNGVPDEAENKVNGTKFGLTKMFKEEVLEASWEKPYQINNSIARLYSLQIAASGGHSSHLHGSDLQAGAYKAWAKLEQFRDREVQASGFSTLNIVNVLENTMHKTAMASFEAAETVWRTITAVRSLNDFKPHNLYYLNHEGHFRKVATDGELKHISMTDLKKTLQAETYGAMITIDRKTRINDDLGVVVDQARSMGSLGALRIEEAVFVLLLSNPGSFYSVGNGNLLSGGTSVLGIDSFTTAEQRFRDQVINGKPISVRPSILVVGTNNSVLAGRLYRQATTAVTTTADVQRFADNPHAGKFTPVVAPYLNNTSITDQDGKGLSGQSNTQWYLFASPNAAQGAALVIGFLNGRQTPFFDEAETQFNIPGGIQMRGYFDFGVAMQLHQMSLKSVGA
jgi:hypothetical protein